MFPQRDLILIGDQQPLRPDRQIQVGFQGDEFLAQRDLIQVLAQVFPDLAGKAVRIGHDPVQAAVLRQPLDRGLGAHLGNPRHVVRCVADQRQVIDDTFRRHPVLFDHAVPVKAGIVHGIDQVNIVINDLRQVFIAGGYQCPQSCARRPGRQGGDHVIRFHVVDEQQWNAQGPDNFMQGFYLGHQVRRGRRTVGLVLGIQVVAETLSLGIEHNRKIIRLLFLEQFAQHVYNAEYGPGRLFLRVREARHGMVGTEQVIGPVNQGQ